MANRLIVEETPSGAVRVTLLREGQAFDEPVGEAAPFAPPMDAAALKDLRWYLEEYLQTPYAVWGDRGRAIAAKLAPWGEALFDSLFGPGKAGRDGYLRVRESRAGCELVLRVRSAIFLGQPWELLKDPDRAEPLALGVTAIDRTLIAAGPPSANRVAAGETLRVLMVIARPAGPSDVGYQMIARPLLQRLATVRGQVDLKVLRPPTLEALDAELRAAKDAGRPYHIVHFDGHGDFGERPSGGGANPNMYDAGARGFLVFEKADGGDDLVPGEEFARLINRADVPLVVLNACQSGMAGETSAEAAVAVKLLEGGAASVVAMGYKVYAVAAAEFMAAFYEALFDRKPVSEAVAEGRRRLRRRPNRPSPKGPLPLEDWIVPVCYRRATVSFPHLKGQARALSLDAALDAARSGDATANDPLAPERRFIGRDGAFYTLERALRTQRVMVVHGPAGTGKTELAKAFGRWLRDTGGVETANGVIFHSFEPGLASFGLDGVITHIGIQLFGPDFVRQTKDAAQREAMILQTLRDHRLLLIWDNFESVHSLPYPTGATPPLDAAEQARMRAFLQVLAREGKSGAILTSRAPETWLGDVRRIELGGLSAPEAVEFADDLLVPYPAAQARRRAERAFVDLMTWLDGHPLSMQILLPRLEDVSADALLSALKGNTGALPPGFVGEGRTESLGASLKYSFDHLEPEDRALVPALALFEGVADEDVLANFSRVEGTPARFTGADKARWSALLSRLTAIGLLSEIGAGMYGLHPALPAWLMAQWREEVAAAFDSEHAAAEAALIGAYAGFGAWLLNQIHTGSAETAFALIDQQRRTMGRLLGMALADGRYDVAQSILQPLNEFWNARGLGEEADGWVDRCRAALENAQGAAPDFETAAGALWLFAVGSQAKRAARAGDLDSALLRYDSLRRQLEAAPRTDSQQRHLAVAYHALGYVAQDRGDLTAAEQWYRQSLQIREALGNRPGVATSYHQLGIVAQLRGDLAAAEQWYRQSLQIEEALGNRPGMAASYHQLGRVAQDRGDLAAAEQWYRQSLQINEALGNRPGMALTYAQLGLLAARRGEPEAALDWSVRAVALFSEFPHHATGTAPRQLIILSKHLGIPALETSWRRCTGQALPDTVRAAVEQASERGEEGGGESNATREAQPPAGRDRPSLWRRLQGLISRG